MIVQDNSEIYSYVDYEPSRAPHLVRQVCNQAEETQQYALAKPTLIYYDAVAQSDAHQSVMQPVSPPSV